MKIIIENPEKTTIHILVDATAISTLDKDGDQRITWLRKGSLEVTYHRAPAGTNPDPDKLPNLPGQPPKSLWPSQA